MTPELYKSERIKRGLSQAALAALVGVSRGCINYREAGHPRYPITVESWLAICSLPQTAKRRSRKGQNRSGSDTRTQDQDMIQEPMERCLHPVCSAWWMYDNHTFEPVDVTKPKWREYVMTCYDIDGCGSFFVRESPNGETIFHLHGGGKEGRVAFAAALNAWTSPNDRSDEADYYLEAYEEAASHLEILAEDLKQGLEKTCLMRVAGTMRKTGKLAYGHDLCHDPDAQRANAESCHGRDNAKDQAQPDNQNQPSKT